MQSKYWKKSSTNSLNTILYCISNHGKKGERSCLRAISLKKGDTFFSLQLLLKSSYENNEYAIKYEALLDIAGAMWSYSTHNEIYLSIQDRDEFNATLEQKNRLKAVFLYLSSLEIPDILDVFFDILRENDIGIPDFKWIPTLADYFNQENYEEALRVLIRLQNSEYFNLLAIFCKALDAHLSDKKALPEGFNIGTFDYAHLLEWYQAIDTPNPFYKEANFRLYHIYLLSLENNRPSLKDQEHLFRFALRSSDQELIDLAWNSFCGFGLTKAFHQIQTNEDTLILIACQMHLLNQKVETLTRENYLLKQQINASNREDENIASGRQQPTFFYNQHNSVEEMGIESEEQSKEICAIQ